MERRINKRQLWAVSHTRFIKRQKTDETPYRKLENSQNVNILGGKNEQVQKAKWEEKEKQNQ